MASQHQPPGIGRRGGRSGKNYRDPDTLRRVHLPSATRLRHAPEILQWAASHHAQLREIAARFGLSRDHLLKLFRRSGVPPPMRQVRRLSLAPVVERLRTTEASLESLAQEFGYADASSLRRALRRAFGLSTPELRNGDRSGHNGENAALGPRQPPGISVEGRR